MEVVNRIVLTEEEYQWARSIGLMRIAAARARQGKHRFGWKPTPQQERETIPMSAAAELFVAKSTGRRWLSSGMVPDDPNAGDVEGGLAVRWTPLEHGSLILHEDDADHLTGVLVTGNDRESLAIRGWINVAEGKQRRWWRTNVRHPAYFVRELCRQIEALDKR